MEELRALHLSVHLPWKEKWSDIQVYTDSRTMTNAWLDSQGPGNNIVGKSVTRIWEEVCGMTFLNG